MKIDSVELRNIRSYEQEIIKFKEGITLLSGDIGSGKTTILKAIEFGLFGTGKGGLEGESLIRHGKTTGKVILTFRVDNKEIKVERTLKKGKSIKQLPGKITIDGVSYELSPTELKHKIIELLGYPLELVSKTKNLLFRYTVYTPQEEMKAILSYDPELRLNILRNLFGIEKYRRVKENTLLLNRYIRNKIKAYGEALGIKESIKKRGEEIEEKIKNSEKKLNILEEEISKLNEDLAREEKKLENLKQQYSEVKERIVKKKVYEEEISSRKKELEQLSKQIRGIESELKKDLEGYSEIELEQVSKEKIQKLEGEEREESLKRKNVEEGLRELEKKKEVLKHKINSIVEALQKINSLKICPLCKQEVSEEHKTKIGRDYGEELDRLKEELKKIEGGIEETIKEKKGLEERELALRQEIDKTRVLLEKKEKVLSLKKLREEMENRKEALTKRISYLHLEISKIGDIDTGGLEEKINEKEKDLEKLRKEKESKISLLSNIKGEINALRGELKNIKADIEDLEKKEKEKLFFEKLYEWIKEVFLPVIDNIEKNLFSSIHYHFEQLFKEWLLSMVEDIDAYLDDSFSPVILIDGYETDINSLSGGERTSVALAYRLALNTVINRMLDSIKTKDLLILDEPTDGFSSEQLEKVGEILSKIGLRQILIVSHEPQLEGFVDNIIRIEKRDGRSIITNP